MSNGDTVAEILEFIENEGADMPKAVTNKMLATVLREKHHIDKENFEKIDKRLETILQAIKANTGRIEDIEKAQIVAAAEKAARECIEKELEEKKDKRFGRLGTVVNWLNDNALVTVILTGLATYLLSLLMG